MTAINSFAESHRRAMAQAGASNCSRPRLRLSLTTTSQAAATVLSGNRCFPKQFFQRCLLETPFALEASYYDVTFPLELRYLSWRPTTMTARNNRLFKKLVTQTNGYNVEQTLLARANDRISTRFLRAGGYESLHPDVTQLAHF